jgi:predicted amino acid dehydrogenase
LNNENIRILPTLSNPLTFRIQPSIQFNQNDLNFLLIGLSNFFKALRKKDVDYLFGHIIPLQKNQKIKNLPGRLHNAYIPEGAAVFICHPIDFKHICEIIDLIEGFGERGLINVLDELVDYQQFTIYHMDKLANKFGNEIDIVILGIPLTSTSFYNALRNGKRQELIKKIQEAVDYANTSNAKSIGLGQFTSIITGNGLYLNSQIATITTGNAYTAGLVIEALTRAIDQHKDLKNLNNASLSIIGAAGNIVQVIGLILVEKVKCLNLVYHADVLSSEKTKQEVIIFLKGCLKSKNEFVLKSKLIQIVKHYPIEENLGLILESISDIFRISSSIMSVKEDDIIIIGTNDTRVLLKEEYAKPGAIVVDIAVPPNTSTNLQKRSDITYIKGGIASLPLKNGEEQHLNSVILPFEKGECFACLAETFGICFEDSWKGHNTGDLTRDMVDNIMQVMQSNGFGLKRTKSENSI